jgi:glycine oxidase
VLKKVDFIIVGQGMAGTFLAHDLIESNQSIAIVDINMRASASRVAAGLINPVGMKRCIPSFNAHLYFPKAIQRYKQLENKLNASFLDEKPLLRLFANESVKLDWQVKFSNTDMDAYISHINYGNTFSFLHDSYGSAEINSCAHLDLHTFLDTSRHYFKANQMVLEERFDFSCFDPDQCTYKNLQATAIIFCEGFRVKDNPYFKSLPLSPSKGEVMTIRIPSIETFDKVISKGVYILPLGNHLFIVGSTYNHNDMTDKLTDAGQSFLKEKINEILSVDYEVVGSVAGVRPTVRDRKPLIGLHTLHNKLGVFNGLGTRGALQGPYLSAWFTTFLTAPKKNMQNTDIQRVNSFLSA